MWGGFWARVRNFVAHSEAHACFRALGASCLVAKVLIFWLVSRPCARFLYPLSVLSPNYHAQTRLFVSVLVNVACSQCNTTCRVIVPTTTKRIMLDKIRAQGAEVTVHGENWNAADVLAREQVLVLRVVQDLAQQADALERLHDAVDREGLRPRLALSVY